MEEDKVINGGNEMKRASIRHRLIALMICLTTLPVITITWIATNNTGNSVEKEIINSNNSRMLWADQYLNELIQQIDTLFNTLQINQQLMDGLTEGYSQDSSVQLKTQNYVRDTLTSVFHANSLKVDDLTLYTNSSQKAISVNFTSSGMIYSLDLRNGPWSRIRNAPVNMYFKQYENWIYAFHSINRFEDKQLLGGISVRINKEVWDEVSSILKPEAESSIFLINDAGELLSGSTKRDVSSEIQQELENLNFRNSKVEFKRTKNNFYFKKRVGDGKLSIVKVIPLYIINQSARDTIKAGVFTGALFTIVSIILSILVSLKISKPIVRLAKSMSHVQIHNFEMKEVESHDEIGKLERCYNSMMQRIKELIENEYKKEIEVKNAQLMALQAQINPHFLNNTLNLIGGMALTKGAPEIYEITRAIGELLRYSISTDSDMALLEEELKHTQNYIFIQEHRFMGRCKIEVSSDESVFHNKLPRFTLQPIVENAFEHGLQRKEGSWKVEVRVREIGNRIILMVKDNGMGICKEKLRQIRSELKEGLWVKNDGTGADGIKKRRGIGLKNVNSRLRLQFGSNSGAKIFSKPGVGTMVVLVIQISKKEVEQDV